MSFPVECINEIFKYFENDKSTLRSCLLVNRLWCRTIIPILWSRSFSLIRNSMNSSLGLIEIYLSFLNEEEKQLYNNYPELYPTSKETLFNYPSFLKEFYYETIFLMIKFWVKTHFTWTESHNNQHNSYNTQVITKVSRKISQSLFKMFLRNNAKVNLIKIKSFDNYPDLPYVPNFQESFSSSFSNLKNFQFSVDLQSLSPNTYSFLKTLSHSCNTLSHIYIDSHFNYNYYEEIFFNIIETQRNIKKFTINPHGIIPNSILNSIINQSSLVLIHFIDTKFIDSFPFEILLSCDNLKFLLIVNCHEDITSSNTSQIKITSKDVKCKIETLHLKNNHFLPLTVSTLIQLSGINLTTLCLDGTKSYNILSEPLSIHCPNITHLILTLDSISLFQSIQSNSLSIIISNLNLVYFGIKSFGWTNEIISDLGNYLPISLKYLELSCFFDFEALYMLLKNCTCQLKGLSMIIFNEDYLSLIIDYAKLNRGFRLLGIDGFLSEENEGKIKALKILKEETNVKIVDQDEIRMKSCLFL